MREWPVEGGSVAVLDVHLPLWMWFASVAVLPGGSFAGCCATAKTLWRWSSHWDDLNQLAVGNSMTGGTVGYSSYFFSFNFLLFSPSLKTSELSMRSGACASFTALIYFLLFLFQIKVSQASCKLLKVGWEYLPHVDACWLLSGLCGFSLQTIQVPRVLQQIGGREHFPFRLLH